MNFTSSQNISQHKLQPVSESPQLPAQATPATQTAYRAIHEEELKKRKGQDGGAHNPDGQESSQSKSNTPALPEIFELLKRYSFHDFLGLYIGEDSSSLVYIVRKNRSSRGVSESKPLSSGHAQNDSFCKQIQACYKNTGWLLGSEPGKAYNGTM